MQDYTVRRRREFTDLREVSEETQVSEDIQAALVLRFSGLSKREQSVALASNSNKFTLEGIECALRIQYADVHSSQGYASRGGRRESGNYYGEEEPPEADPEPEVYEVGEEDYVSDEDEGVEDLVEHADDLE
eukprot:1358287-Lingulodinium_polyedra.AAC.1